MEQILEGQMQMNCLEQTYGALDSHARTSAWQESNSVLKGNVQVYFSQLQDLLGIQKKKIDPSTYLLRTLKTYLVLMEEQTSLNFSLSWMKSGMMQNGKLSIVPGIYHKTERTFIIGHLRGRSTRKVFPITENSRQTSIKQIGNTVSTGNWNNPQRGRVYSPKGICPALNCMQGGGLEPKIMVVGTTKSNTAKGTNCRSWVYDSRGIIGALTATDYKQPKQILVKAVLTPDRINKRQNGRRFKEVGEPMFTLTAQDRHGVAIKEATKKGYAVANKGDSINLEQPNSKTRRGRVGKGIANTLTTSCNQGVLDGYRIRKLTPKECWRLQGWNDKDFEKAAKVCSDTQLYKQAGNGVTVPVIYEIAKRL